MIYHLVVFNYNLDMNGVIYETGVLPRELVEDPSRKNELMEYLKDPHFFVDLDCELLLFRNGYEDHLMEYLSHHALMERNQWVLFESQNEKVLDFYIEHWVLASIYEKKLCTLEYRNKWLMKYLDYHNFADSDNEILLFDEGMENFRSFYISQTSFHSRKVECKLFEPQFKADLEAYINNRRMFYAEFVNEFIKVASPELVSRYNSYSKK